MINYQKINHKKIEPKIKKEHYYPKKEINLNNNLFINLDINISESNESNVSLNLNKYTTIKNKNIFTDKNLIKLKKRPVKLKPKYIKTNTFKLFKDTNSTTTNTSDFNFKGIKKVTFSTVEIIRVEKYKKINAKNNFPKINIEHNIEELKKNKSKEESFCCIF